MKKSYLITLTLLLCLSCKEGPVSYDSVYEYQEEPVALFNMKLYADSLSIYYIHTKVSQTNPLANVSEDELSMMEASINDAVDYHPSDSRMAIADKLRIRINDRPSHNLALSFSAWTESSEFVTDKYAGKGRESLFRLFGQQNITGFFTTFEDIPAQFSTNIWADFRDHLVGLDAGDDAMFAMYDKDTDSGTLLFPSNASFTLPSVLQQPDLLVKEHALIHDRFDNRVYVAEDGHQYKTLVVVKKLIEMKDYDRYAPSPYKPDLGKLYPVVQFYKDDELLMEAWPNKYTECFYYTQSSSKTRTEIEFDCITHMNGYVYWIQFQNGMFEIYVSDFSQPTDTDDFTRIDIRQIRIISDYKPGGRPSISES